MQNRLRLLVLLLIVSHGAMAFGQARPLDPKDAQLPKVQMPEQFALVFSFGYVTDWMPKDPATFERMLENMKRTGINTVHCKYTDGRLALCEKHGIMMMIDLAVPEHDLKQARCELGEAEDISSLDGAEEKFVQVKSELDKILAGLREVEKELKPGNDRAAPAPERTAELEKETQALAAKKTELEKRKAILIASNVKYICKKVHGSKGVWGYGLYYDAGTHGSYLNHAIEKLRTWDPTHVAFVGSYRHGGLETVTLNPGCYGWYDFHWQRGTLWHYLDMMVVHDICKRRGAIMANYPQYSGLQQDLFTLNQCIAAGAKMTIWFIGGPMSRDTYEWNDDNDLVRIAAEVRPLYRELALIGHPAAFYSTPVTRTHDNKPLDKPGVPRWFKPLPADLWVQITGGEAMIGLFQYADGTDALYIANHNAFAPQKMSLTIAGGAKVERFDRATRSWRELPKQDGSYAFDLPAAGGELVRVSGRQKS
jgi:hypothetical protein